MEDYYKNTEALRIVNSFCRAPVRGNCRGNTNTTPNTNQSDFVPLPKRRRTTK